MSDLERLLFTGRYELALKMEVEELSREACILDEDMRLPISYLIDSICSHRNLFNSAIEIFNLLFKIVLAHDAKLLKIKDILGYTLLLRAISTHKEEIILPLIPHSDLSIEITFGAPPYQLKYDALGLALTARLKSSIIRFLICDGTINIKNLHDAIRNNYIEAVKKILEKRPDFLHELYGGTTALHEAVLMRNENITKLLLETFKANPNIFNNDGYTPLCIITNSNYIYNMDFMEYLLICGADPNFRAKASDMSPVERAIRRQLKSLLILFVKYYPDTQLELDSWPENDALEFKKEVEQYLIPDVKGAI